MLCDTLFPNDLLVSVPILSSLTLYQRQRPFIGPYFRCTFCTFQHQFFCDTVVTTSTLSQLVQSISSEKNSPDIHTTSRNSTASSNATSTSITSTNNPNVDDYCTFDDSHHKRRTKSKLLLHRPETQAPASKCKNGNDDDTGNMADQYALLNVLLLLAQLVHCTVRRALSTIFHPYLLLTYLTFLVYWPSLWANLVFDDRPAIIENRDVKPESTSWTQLWYNDFWGTPLRSPFSHKSYRPLTVLTFRLNYIVHQLSSFGYHLVNLLLHSLVSVVFYRYCILFFNESPPPPPPKTTTFYSNNKNENKEEINEDIKKSTLCAIFSSLSSMFSKPIPNSIINKSGISKNFQKLNHQTEKRLEVCKPTTYSPAKLSSLNSSSCSSSHPVLSSFHYLKTTSFYVAVLFAVHPIHTDCVSSVVGRAEMLSALFYLGAILTWTGMDRKDTVYHHHRRWTKSQTMSSSKSSQSDSHHTKLRQLLKAILFAFMGFLCKEQSIFVLIYLAFYELVPINLMRAARRDESSVTSSSLSTSQPCLLSVRRRLSQLSSSSFQSSSQSSLSKCSTIILLAVSFLSAIYIRFVLMDFTMPSFNRFDNPASRASFPVRWVTYAYLAVYHFWLLLFPFQLSCDWTHASIDLIDFSSDHFYLDLFRSFLTLMAGLTLLVVLCFLTIVVFIAQARKPFATMLTTCKANQLLGSITGASRDIELSQRTLHAILLTVIPFLPASNLFVPTGFVIAERILYLPSIGFLLLLGIGLKQIVLKFQNLNCPFKCPILRKRFNLFHNGKSIKLSPSCSQLSHKSAYCIFYYMVPLFIVAIFSAKTYIRSIDWTNEYSLYESGLSVNPRNTKLLNNLGRLHEKDNQINVAIDLYLKAINIEPTDVRSHLNLGNSLIKINDKVNAEKSYKNALKQIEEDLWENPGQIKERQSPTIAKYNNDFLNRSKLSPLYFTALVRLSELIGRDTERKEDLKQIQEKMKKFQKIWGTNSMNIAADTGKKACAKSKNFDDSFQLNQLYNLAIMHYRIGHLKEALNYFEQVLTLNPHHEDSLLASARIIQDEGMHQLNSVAFDRLERLIELGKGDETVHFNQAMLAVKANKYSLARQLFTEAISKRPTFTEAHYNLALLLIKEIDSDHHPDYQNNRQKEYNLDQAIKHLKKVLAINPKHAKSMLVLGDLYAEKLDQIPNARHYYQIVIDKIDTYNARARHNLCVLWYKQNNLDRAIDCFRLLQNDFQKLNHDNIDLTINRINEQIAILIKTKENLSWTSPTKSIDSINMDVGKRSSLNLEKTKQKIHNRNESQKLTSKTKDNAFDTRYNHYQPLMTHKQLSSMCLI